MSRGVLLAGVVLGVLPCACESGKPRGADAPASAAHTQVLPMASASAPTRPAASVADVAPSADFAPLPATSVGGAAHGAVSGAGQGRQPCNVALLGDSLTDYQSHGGGYVRYLEEHCPRSHFQNFAKGGAMVNQIRRRFDETLASEPRGTYSHVVIFAGVNDLYSDETAGRTTAKIEADLTALYAGARALGARVVAITVAPWGGFTRWFTPHRGDTTRELNAWILGQTADGSVDVAVDAHALLSCGDPDRLCARYERAVSDGLHFGQAGHVALGALLYEREFRACP